MPSCNFPPVRLVPSGQHASLPASSQYHDPTRFHSLVQNKQCQQVWLGCCCRKGPSDLGHAGVAIVQTSPVDPEAPVKRLSVFVAGTIACGQPRTSNIQLFRDVGCNNQATPAAFCVLRQNQEVIWQWAAYAIAHQLKPEGISLAALPECAVPIFNNIMMQAGYVQTYSNPCLRYVTNKQMPQMKTLLNNLPTLIDAPSLLDSAKVCQHRVSLGRLSLQDAKAVDDTWAYKSDSSLELIQQIIAKRHTSCIRLVPLADTPSLEPVPPVAWVLHQVDGSIGMAYTLPEYRKLGLMSVCTADIVQQVLQAGEQPEVFSYVVQSNSASINMMAKLGFEDTGAAYWMGYKKVMGSRL